MPWHPDLEEERGEREKGKEWVGMEGEKEEFTSKDRTRLCLPFHSHAGSFTHAHWLVFQISLCLPQRFYNTYVCTAQEHTQLNGQPSNPRANGCAWFSDHWAVLKLTFSWLNPFLECGLTRSLSTGICLSENQSLWIPASRTSTQSDSKQINTYGFQEWPWASFRDIARPYLPCVSLPDSGLLGNSNPTCLPLTQGQPAP